MEREFHWHENEISLASILDFTGMEWKAVAGGFVMGWISVEYRIASKALLQALLIVKFLFLKRAGWRPFEACGIRTSLFLPSAFRQLRRMQGRAQGAASGYLSFLRFVSEGSCLLVAFFSLLY